VVIYKVLNFYIINNVNKFKQLSKHEIDADRIDKWTKGKLENIKFVVNNYNVFESLSKAEINKVKYLIENVDGFKELLASGITIEDLGKCKDWTSIEYLIDNGYVMSFINSTNGMNNVKGLVDNDINKLVDLLSDGHAENNLVSCKIDFDKIAMLSNKDIETVKFLLGYMREIDKLSEHKQVWQEVQTIMLSSTDSNDPSWKYSKLVTKNSDEVISLANAGIGVKNLQEIYDKNPDLAEAIVKNNKVVVENFLNKDSKLNVEDLKKCKAEDILALANNEISPEQLKASIAERTTFAAPKSPPIGKWTTQIQQGRQSNEIPKTR